MGNQSKSSIDEKRIVAQNRKARHDYFIEEVFEAGIVLTGSEVKSLRLGKASLQDAFASIEQAQLVLRNAHIPEYVQSHARNHAPTRPRILLLHHRQILKLIGKLKVQGVTLIPLAIYFNAKNIAKLELALAHGKKQHDKREAIKERDWKRQKDRMMKK